MFYANIHFCSYSERMNKYLRGKKKSDISEILTSIINLSVVISTTLILISEKKKDIRQ